MPEFAQRCFIRYQFFHKVDTGESPRGIAVINRVLCSRTRKLEPDLRQVHPQHFFDDHERTAALSFGMIRRYYLCSFNLWYDLIHDFRKLFPLCFLLPDAVFDVSEGLLLHCHAPPCLFDTIMTC